MDPDFVLIRVRNRGKKADPDPDKRSFAKDPDKKHSVPYSIAFWIWIRILKTNLNPGSLKKVTNVKFLQK